MLERTEDIINDINAYVSQNTFYRPQRRIENIKELRAVYIDIDCYNSKYTKEAVQYFLENDFYGHKIPRPNYLIDSGRGLYYVILIKSVPSMAMPLWYAVQRYLFNALKQFGADGFTRAFREWFGINPSEVKNTNNLKIFPRMTFQLTIKGGSNMNYRIEEKGDFKLVGLKAVCLLYLKV